MSIIEVRFDDGGLERDMHNNISFFTEHLKAKGYDLDTLSEAATRCMDNIVLEAQRLDKDKDLQEIVSLIVMGIVHKRLVDQRQSIERRALIEGIDKKELINELLRKTVETEQGSKKMGKRILVE